jgi:uncharacterized protein (DUF924 family)
MRLQLAARFITAAIHANIDEEDTSVTARRFDSAVYMLMAEGEPGAPDMASVGLNKGAAVEATLETMEYFEHHKLTKRHDNLPVRGAVLRESADRRELEGLVVEYLKKFLPSETGKVIDLRR